MARKIALFAVIVLALGFSGCGAPSLSDGDVCPEPDIGSLQEPLSTIDCSATTDTGYTDGTRFTITVVTVDGKKVEQETANAYYVMAQAASADGVEIRIVSGFRTMQSQEYLYACYVNCNCNNCNLAAKPGYSNHQSGHALDLNTSATGVLAWLNAHGAAFGFKRTVPSEAWHWEWWGGGPGGGPCHAAGDAAIDGKRDASGSDAASGNGDGSIDGARAPEADGADGGSESSPAGDNDPGNPSAVVDAGAGDGSTSSGRLMTDAADSMQGGCSCRIGATQEQNREPFARLWSVLASLALLAVRRRSRQRRGLRMSCS